MYVGRSVHVVVESERLGVRDIAAELNETPDLGDFEARR
jgi:hypothetical protein